MNLTELDYRLISNYLINNMSFVFNIDEYYFPKYINNKNIHDSVNNEINRKDSSFVKNWDKDLTLFIKNDSDKFFKGSLDYIKEFPIPIENKNLWQEILKSLGVSDKQPLVWDKDFFKLDYFFPKYKLAVEIDSDFHLGFPNVQSDQSRDLYMSDNYGIYTLRLLKYGENIKNRKLNFSKFTNKIDEIRKNWKINNQYVPRRILLDFSYSISKNFIDINKNTFELISELKENSDFLLNNKIYVKKSDFIKKYALESKDFTDNVCKLTKLIFLKEIKFV